jgi:CRP-like cAMP-binding protein
MHSVHRLTTTTLSRTRGHTYQLRTKLTSTNLMGYPKASPVLRRSKSAKSPSHRSSNTPPPSVSSAKPTNKRQNATLAAMQAVATPKEVHHQTFWQALDDILRRPRTIPIPRWISPRHHAITLSEIFGHASFIIVAFSYAVDDFLMLRIIAVAGSTVMLFFTYWHPHGRILWLPFKWNVLFIAINSYRIGRVYQDRYMAERLSPEMLALREKNFYLMDPVDFAKLVRLGTIEEYDEGDMILDQGESSRYVRMMLNGTCKVLRDGKITYQLEEANFISESGLHVGLMLHGKIEACCALIAETPVRVMCWDRTALVDLMQRDISLRRSLKAVLSWDIVRKLKGQRNLLANHVIDDPDEWNTKRNEQTRHRYAAILHNLLSHTKDLKLRRSELDKYRNIHHIDDEHHKAALKKFGWTPEEFEAGKKKGQTEEWIGEDEDEQKHDWKWYLHDLYLRAFG